MATDTITPEELSAIIKEVEQPTGKPYPSFVGGQWMIIKKWDGKEYNFVPQRSEELEIERMLVKNRCPFNSPIKRKLKEI